MYEKQNFIDGQVLKAEHLNKIEDGIVNQSWNDLKDKPFGDGFGDTVTFDGNTEGKICVDGMMYKVSNAVPTYADFLKGGTVVMNGEEVALVAEDLPPQEEVVLPSGIICLQIGVFVIPPEMAGVMDEDLGLTFPEAGTYFAYSLDAGLLVTKLQVNDYEGFETVNRIEEKYIPLITEKSLGIKTFYIKGDTDYLYTDIGCTNKAVLSDVPDTNLFNIAAVAGKVVAYWCTPLSVCSRICGKLNGYQIVYYRLHGDIRIAYTAEYTPTEVTNE